MSREKNKNTYEKMMMIYENTIFMRREQMDIKKNWDETMSAVQTMMERMDDLYNLVRADYINVIDSIDAVHVETNNYNEEMFVLDCKSELKKLLGMIVRKEKAESNRLEWEMLCRYRDLFIKPDNGNMENLEQELKIERSAKEDLEQKLTAEQDARKELENRLANTREELEDRLTAEQNVKEELEDRLSEEQEAKENLERSLSEEQKANEDLKQSLSEEQKANEDLKQSLSKEQKAKEKVEQSLSEEQEAKEKLEQNLSEEQEAKEKLEQNLSEEQEAKEKLEQNLSEEQEAKKKLEQSLSKEQKVNKDLEHSLSEEQEINNNLKKELDVVKQNKEEIANSLKTLTEDTENKKEEFNSAIADYKKIFDCMLKCDSMETLITEKMGISLNESLSIKDAITLANNIGKGFTFARKVVEQLSDYKSEHIECLTENEIKLINAINDYYRKIDKKYEEFVALDCLGLDVQEKVSFDRKKMRDMNNPRGNDFVSAVEIYVPALYMENGGDIEKKALIKGE